MLGEEVVVGEWGGGGGGGEKKEFPSKWKQITQL